MIKTLMTFVSDKRGATMIEYGLIAALIAVFLIVALQGLGTGLDTLFQTVEDNL